MTTIQEAKEILGENNVFGPDEWKKFFGDKFQVDKIPEIPWSKAELENPVINQEHFLFFGMDALGGEPVTLSMWRDLYRMDKGSEQPLVRFDSPYKYSNTCGLRWYLLPVGHVEGGPYKLEKQLSMLPLEYGVANATERVTANILYFFLNKKFLQNARCRGREIVSSKTNNLFVQNPTETEEGLEVNISHELNIGEGVAASREIHPREKPTTTLQDAKEILGEKNVFGLGEWLKYFPGKVILSQDQLDTIKEIPWPKSVLLNPDKGLNQKHCLNQKHFLFLGIEGIGPKNPKWGQDRLNLIAWQKLLSGNKHPKFSQDLSRWYITDANPRKAIMIGNPKHFAYDSCALHWYFTPVGIWEKSIGLGFNRLNFLSEYPVATAIERITANILYYILNGKYLDVPPQIARTKDITNKKEPVCVWSEPKGLKIGFGGPGKFFGLALTRKIPKNI